MYLSANFPNTYIRLFLCLFSCIASLRDIPAGMTALGEKLCQTPRHSTYPVIVTPRILQQPRFLSNHDDTWGHSLSEFDYDTIYLFR